MGFVETKTCVTKSARFFTFSIIKGACVCLDETVCADEKTKKKVVVSATSSGSACIVVFKRRFLDVLTLLVEKARRSFF